MNTVMESMKLPIFIGSPERRKDTAVKSLKQKLYPEFHKDKSIAGNDYGHFVC